MFTPQELQERGASLEKAVFGGYSVDSVDQLLEPLQEDYAALYKENAVLKSKMKVLVEKLEEYRSQEDSIKKTLLKAQQAADEMVANAERRSAKMLTDSEQRLRERSRELNAEVEAEQQRVDLAKQATARYIVEMEERVQAQLEALEKIKQMNLGQKQEAKAPQPAPEAKQDPEAVAQEIGASISRIVQEAGEDLGDTKVIRPVE